ncbi:hypothetical protein [Caulobacter sp. RHG1]|uniref:hypothetical protein n=1 Tax=Caulobacter sp. (strain RHG1) TaxID=2545762 RepID=UPI001551EB22|nr:hypothetical protein [Caulobacter sp. RHG1]NQE63315.1 hypothetical protein [Caulobacter sp. RHG1]
MSPIDIQIRRGVRHQTVSQRPPQRRRRRYAPIVLAILAAAAAWALIVFGGVTVGAWLA